MTTTDVTLVTHMTETESGSGATGSRSKLFLFGVMVVPEVVLQLL